MQKFTDLVQGNIFKFRVEWTVGRKNVRFQRKTGHTSETVKDTVNVVTNTKWHIGFQMKIIDLE